MLILWELVHSAGHWMLYESSPYAKPHRRTGKQGWTSDPRTHGHTQKCTCVIQRLLLPVEQWVPYPGQTDHLPQRGGRGENEHLLGVDLPGATGYSIPTMTFNPSCVWARKKAQRGHVICPKSDSWHIIKQRSKLGLSASKIWVSALPSSHSNNDPSYLSIKNPFGGGFTRVQYNDLALVPFLSFMDQAN